MPGHAWGNIVHRNDVTWLVSYVDSSIRKDNHKYVQFAATSRFKQMNDKRKYEKARKLKECIRDIRKDYQQKLVSDNSKQR
jgi:DNA topoisomerase-1